MKKRILILTALTATLAMLAGSAGAAESTTFVFPGGTITTSNHDAWGGVNGVVYPVAFDVDAEPLTMIVYGLDMSAIDYRGDWGWPVGAEDLGAIATVGVAGDPTLRFDMTNGAWYQLHSTLGGGAGSWDNQSAKYTHDDGYRKYLLQAWNSYLTGGKQFPDGPNHQYNAESYVVPNALHPTAPGTDNPSDYNTFDLRIVISPDTRDCAQYKMEGYVRLHRAASNDEGAYWKWNRAIAPMPPQDPNPENAWVKIGGHLTPSYRCLSGLDFSAVRPFVNIANWGTQQTNYHTISWGSVEATGVPNPQASKELCKKDGWKLFTDPSFKNQGQCVSYFAEMK